jgi:ubiquinone/menaquinone biosynthesis C-methylase UbiE
VPQDKILFDLKTKTPHTRKEIMQVASENWQLSNDAASLYEKYVYPLMQPWVAALIEKGRVAKGDQVLDAACGTGFVSRRVAELVGSTGHVAGADLNRGMILAAQEITNRTSELPIEWRVADAAELPFDNERFDVALCQQGMQFFPDSAGAISELHRVLKPGGWLAFTIWGPIEENPYLGAVANALKSHLNEQAANGFRAAFAKSYRADFDDALHDVGFMQIQVDSPVLAFRLPPLQDYLPGHLASLPMAGAIAALPCVKKQALITDVSNALQGFADGNGVTIPSRSEVVSAVK